MCNEKCIRCGRELTPEICGQEYIETGICVDCWTAGDEDDGSTHKPICSEYWDRGLNCQCIPKEEQERIQAAVKRGDSTDDIIDPGWGPN